MSRKLKCYGWCGEKYPKDELKQFGSKNFCKKCYDRKIKDSDGLKVLHETISKVYEIPFANGQMLRQMKAFRDERNYEYEDIAKAILYAKYILNKQMHVKYGLGLVPYVIEDAKKYYADQLERVENMKGKDISTTTNTVKKQYLGYKKDEIKNKRIIDMEDILE